jgi:ATPase subunit of ABC transporter with duplicated ATPase domains
MNTLRNNAEKSTSKLRDVHAEKIGSVSKQIGELRNELPGVEMIKIDLDHSQLHHGKRLIDVQQMNFSVNGDVLWRESLSFLITSGERVAIKGLNGSGKTTLIKILLGELVPQIGSISRAAIKAVYIDQDYSQVIGTLTVFEQVQKFNINNLPEHELKIRLNRFLFTKEHWDKKCASLSGGEKMRLMLCCLVIANQAPDVMVLDEPTNNLDIQNIEILTNAIVDYPGTLIVVSHDQHFLRVVGAEREIVLERAPAQALKPG